MRVLLKIIGINLLILLACSVTIEYLTRNDWEGFAHSFYYAFCLGLQILINLILTIIAAFRKSRNTKYYAIGLFLLIIAAIVIYGWIV